MVISGCPLAFASPLVTGGRLPRAAHFRKKPSTESRCGVADGRGAPVADRYGYSCQSDPPSSRSRYFQLSVFGAPLRVQADTAAWLSWLALLRLRVVRSGLA